MQQDLGNRSFFIFFPHLILKEERSERPKINREAPAEGVSDMAGGNHSSKLLPFPLTQQTLFHLKNISRAKHHFICVFVKKRMFAPEYPSLDFLIAMNVS